MPQSFDDHLEATLQLCNDRINQLEGSECSDGEMLDALINRGSVLCMMEYYVSALSDFNDAADTILRMERRGEPVNPGSFVRVFTSRGELCEDKYQMAEDYALASARLGEIGEDTRFYDRKKIINMCLNCCEDLLDGGHPGETAPFAEKLNEMIAGHDDDWSENRRVEMLNINAQSMKDMNMYDEAAGYFSDAIDIGCSLLQRGVLDDRMSLIFAFVLRGDIEQEKGLIDQYLLDRKAAISMLEELMSVNKLDDLSVLIRLHQDIANTYLTLNMVTEAEEHLLREVVLSMDGAEEYIKEYAGKDRV